MTRLLLVPAHPALWAALWLAMLAGCGRSWSPDSVRFTGEPSYPAAEAWPARVDPANPPADAAQIVMSPGRPDSGPTDMRITHLGAFGAGQLFEYHHDTLEEGRWFVFRSIRAVAAEERVLPHTEQTESTDPSRRTDGAPWRYVESITPIRLLEPSNSIPRKGLIVYHASLSGGNSFEWRFLNGMRKRGWRILAVTPEDDLLQAFARVRATLDGEEGLRDFAAEMARRGDQALAERAYATEGALSWLLTADARAASEPVVLMGVSAGAIALPTVAARLGSGAVDATVLIIGGANLLAIFDESSMIRFRREVARRATPELLAMYDQTSTWYLEYSTLDPWHSAAAIRGSPALVVHAAFDAVVPARTGDELWRRLGKPQRWSLPFGHYGAIWWLPNMAGDISRWAEAATRE